MSSWPLLVTLHNLVNVPLEACENGKRAFVVEAHMGHRVAAYSAPVVTAMFTTDDVVSTTPGLLEVRLDDIPGNRGDGLSGGHRGGPKVWRCALPELEVVVMVREIVSGIPLRSRFPSSTAASSPVHADDGDGSRVVGSSAPVLLNAKRIVEEDKLTTRIVGTDMGQVGVSFTVDTADTAGYRYRLESFLRLHNPQGLRLVPSVVEVVSELDTFTKLYRRYEIRNYEERLADFFAVYGPQYKEEIPILLRQWEGREEELIRNLVLDNGPELSTIDVHQRLTAFLTAHQLEQSAAGVQAILAAHPPDGGAAKGLFADLVERYGPEPDPRTYLFPAPHYTPPTLRPALGPSEPPAVKCAPSPPALHYGSPAKVDRSAGTPRRTPPMPPSGQPYLSVAMSPTPVPGGEAPHPIARSLDRSPSFAVENSKGRGSRNKDGSPPRNPPVISPSHRPLAAESVVDTKHRDGSGAGERLLWRKLCSLMKARQRRATTPWRESALFYLSEAEFGAAVRALKAFAEDPDGGEVQALIEEWSRRVRHALTEEALSPNDAYFSAAVQEAAKLTGLQPLHLQVTAVSSLFHREHYSGFSAYMEERAKRAKTERLVLVGETQKLLDVARFGFHASFHLQSSSNGVSASAEAGAEEVDRPMVFFREPFRPWASRHACSILVCDVAVGAMYACPPTLHAPREATQEFIAAYDSCAYVDEANGPAVAVYARQQVLPRILLQGVVDPQQLPCPAHPDRPVEYYVLDAHAFACSRCVVLGAYKGREVTPIEEAAVMARTGLAEIARTASALKESLLAYHNQLDNEEQGVANAPHHVEAAREIDRLQKEMEERVRRIRREVQLKDDEQLSRIHAERSEVVSNLQAVDELGQRLTTALQLRTPAESVNALQHLQQEGQVEQLLARMQERVPAAPLERVLPLDGPSVVPPSPSPKMRRRWADVAGLNESHLPGGSDRGQRRLPSTTTSPRKVPKTSSHLASGVSSPGSLYAQYLALTGAEGRAGGTVDTCPQDSLRIDGSNRPRPKATTAAGRSPPVSRPHQGKRNGKEEDDAHAAKEALTRGWALLRHGDVTGAQRMWSTVCERHGTDDVMGTKARAYIAEAIEKDYTAAAQWYAKSLQLDPQDRMTAYNYGVLMEALLEKPHEALRLYDRAAALGDRVAAARAREVRDQLKGSSPLR